MPSQRIWLGHAPDVPQIDLVEFDEAACTILAEGSDLLFKINHKELLIEAPAPIDDLEYGVEGDTGAIAALLAAAEAAINSSDIPEFAEIEATHETPDASTGTPYHRLRLESRTPGEPFTVAVSGPHPTIDVDTLVEGGPGVNERQSIVLGPPDLTGGTWTVTWNPGGGAETSAAIAWDADAAAVKAAIVAGMASVDDADLAVTGSGTSEDPFILEFTGTYEETDVAEVTVDPSGLTGGGVVSVATLRDGGAGALDDTFTDAAGTDLQNHTADSGHTWAVDVTGSWVQGDLEIGSNKLKLDASGSGTAIGRSSLNESPDVSGSVKVAIMHAVADGGGARSVGLLFRWADANNFWRAVLAADAGSDDWELRLEKVVAGTPTTVDSVAIGTWGVDFTNQLNTLSITIAGDDLSATLSGVGADKSVSATDGHNNTQQTHGLYASTTGPTDGANGFAEFDTLSLSGGSASNEQQAVWTNGTGGTFALTRPETAAESEAISATASTAALQGALETLYGAGNVSVASGSGTSADPWIVDFQGALAGTDLQTMAGDGANLTGIVAATIETVEDGSAPTAHSWSVAIHCADGGTFALSFRGRRTGDIAWGALAATVQTALEALAPGDFSTSWSVSGAGTFADPYVITVAGDDLVGVSQHLDAHNEDLTTSNPLGIVHTTLQQATGKHWWDNPVNWRDQATGDSGVPQAGDEVFFQEGGPDQSVRHGLAQSAVQLKRLVVSNLFRGEIGLPWRHASGYVEYRQTHLAIGLQAGATIDAPNILIGTDRGQGSGLIRLDTGSDETHLRIERTGGPSEEGAQSLDWHGSNVGNTLQVLEGFVSVTKRPGVSAALQRIIQRGGLLYLSEGLAVQDAEGIDSTAGELYSDGATIAGVPLILRA